VAATPERGKAVGAEEAAEVAEEVTPPPPVAASHRPWFSLEYADHRQRGGEPPPPLPASFSSMRVMQEVSRREVSRRAVRALRVVILKMDTQAEVSLKDTLESKSSSLKGCRVWL